jgi:hypothetical protein
MKHMKHASERLAATPNLLLKHPDENMCKIRTKIAETLETCK